MLSLLLAASLSCGPHADRVADTLDIPALSTAPSVDGRIDERVYGSAALRIPTLAGDVRVWIGHHGDHLYLAATLPDATFYWGDDFVVSFDANGSGGTSPGPGDRQWYLRRVLDSSFVARAANGRWFSAGEQPTMLGSSRHHADWDVASASSTAGWTIELRIRTEAVNQGPSIPRLAIRTYNDQPSGWWSWPAPATGIPAQRVERTPDLWIPFRLR